MTGTELALYNVGSALLASLQASFHKYGRVATGKTINALEFKTFGYSRLILYGPAYLVQLEKGRNSTSKTGPYQRYGGLTFKESLALWMAARGIDQGKKPNSTQKYGPVLWAIYTEINNKGYAGTPGLVTNPLSTENIDKVMTENLGPLMNLYTKNFLDQIFK